MNKTGRFASGARSRFWGTAIAATLLLCLNSPVLAKDHPGKGVGVGVQVQAAPQLDKQALKELRKQQHAAAKAERAAARAQQQAARAVATQPSAKAQRKAAKAQQKA